MENETPNPETGTIAEVHPQEDTSNAHSPVNAPDPQQHEHVDVQPTDAQSSDAQPMDIGGWLVLIGVGLMISPFMVAWQTFKDFGLLFTGDGWSALSESTAGFSLLPVVTIELLANLLLIGGLVWLIRLFLRKDQRFPKTYAFVLVGFFAFSLFDAVVVSQLFEEDTTSVGACGRQPAHADRRRIRQLWISSGPHICGLGRIPYAEPVLADPNSYLAD